MAFVAFEGIDGAGKSTLISAFAEHLRVQQIASIITREPGGTPLAEKIRELFIVKTDEAVATKTEVLLLQASRAQHVETVIKPALAKNQWVVSDRFSLSSLAFQSGGRGLPASEIKWLNDFSTSQLSPDLYVIVDLDPRLALDRQRSRTKDRIESESLEFHRRVREFYLEYAEENPTKCILINGERPTQESLKQLLSDSRVRHWLG
jgi:dTMP kinase